MARIRKLMAAFSVCAVACLSLLLVACAAPSANQPDPEYSATVPALVPTYEAVSQSTSESATSIPPTVASASPTDTAVPPTDPPPPPTYTPRPLPTYTPRPAPVPVGDGGRSEGIPFQAQTLDGSVINLSDTHGTPTLLAFWAPW